MDEYFNLPSLAQCRVLPSAGCHPPLYPRWLLQPGRLAWASSLAKPNFSAPLFFFLYFCHAFPPYLFSLSLSSYMFLVSFPPTLPSKPILYYSSSSYLFLHLITSQAQVTPFSLDPLSLSDYVLITFASHFSLGNLLCLFPNWSTCHISVIPWMNLIYTNHQKSLSLNLLKNIPKKSSHYMYCLVASSEF